MGDPPPSIAMVYPSQPHTPTRTALTDLGHPSHRGFARAVGAADVPLVQPRVSPPSHVLADLCSAMGSRIPDHDIYLLENDSVLYLAPALKERHPDSLVIHLAAAHRIARHEGLDRTALAEDLDTAVDHYLLGQLLNQYCDGVLAVSTFMARRVRRRSRPGMPIRVVHPYIQPAAFRRLRTVEPNVRSSTAVTVGQWRGHKGMDLLIDAWPRVRRRIPDAELRIVGPDHPRTYERTPGVTVRGYVDDIRDELAAASLYVHPARVEPFGVSVVEAMCAGLPSVVTRTTGAAEVVRRVDEALVCDPSPVSLAKAICGYFGTATGRRLELSRRGREASAPFVRKTQTERFRRQFQTLVETVRQRSPATGRSEAPAATGRVTSAED